MTILTQRFGDIDAPTRQRIVTADIDDCDRWINRTLDAPTLHHVFG